METLLLLYYAAVCWTVAMFIHNNNTIAKTTHFTFQEEMAGIVMAPITYPFTVVTTAYQMIRKS